MWQRGGILYTVLVGKPDKKRPYGIPRYRWEELEWMLRKNVVWVWTGFVGLGIGTIGRLVVNMGMNLWVL
jgi:hypothetical protein